MRRAYKLVSSRETYRTFPTQNEADQYRSIVMRDIPVTIIEVEQYPNSRFINNRPLNIRGQHG